MTLPVLTETGRTFGVTIPEALFTTYQQAILAENDAYGLTSLRELSEVELQLLADSLAWFDVKDRPPGPLIDLGSGAGIPGIPLALVDPTLEVTLLEARQRKGQFLARIVERLGLRHRVRVVSGRAETMGKDAAWRDQFAVAAAKGLAPLNILLELAMPFLRVGGLLVAWKGPGADAEIEQAQHAFSVLHAQLESKHPYTLPQDPATRCLLLIRKTAPTPPTYPRRPGMAKKNPL